MLNSLSRQPAHTKDSLKQNGHYFWKQDQGLLFEEAEEETVLEQDGGRGGGGGETVGLRLQEGADLSSCFAFNAGDDECTG